VTIAALVPALMIALAMVFARTENASAMWVGLVRTAASDSAQAIAMSTAHAWTLCAFATEVGWEWIALCVGA